MNQIRTRFSLLHFLYGKKTAFKTIKNYKNWNNAANNSFVEINLTVGVRRHFRKCNRTVGIEHSCFKYKQERFRLRKPLHDKVWKFYRSNVKRNHNCR